MALIKDENSQYWERQLELGGILGERYKPRAVKIYEGFIAKTHSKGGHRDQRCGFHVDSSLREEEIQIYTGLKE